MTFPRELHQELETLLRSSPLLDLLGIELVSWLPGSATLKMTTTSQQGNLAGSVHGGVIFSLADAAFEIGCNSHGRLSVALETACHYSRPARIGDTITASCEEVVRSRRTASYRIDVRDSAGELIAWYMALAYRTERWHLGEERWPDDWRLGH